MSDDTGSLQRDRNEGANLNDMNDPVDGQSFAYGYDNIGNRTSSLRENEEMNYTANNLNQYTQRTIPDGIDILGSAETNTSVTVNDLATSRYGKYWYRALTVTNDSSAAYQDVSVVGVYNPPGTNDPDIVSSETGHVFVAKTPEVFNYDDDGNLLTDGRFNYTWDCENRLIGAETRTGLSSSVPRVQLAFTYDYMSRRVSKTVYEWISGSWSLKQSSRFLYDGWNLVSEVCAATGKGTVTDYYVWGLDLSGSLQGAGGVGGLLARYRSVTRFYDDKGMLIICHRPPGNPKNAKTLKINESAWPSHQAHGDTLGACDGSSVSNSAFFYTFDGNGNVSELISTTSLAVTAHYEYSPFGETIVAAGPEAFDNPFRFSTKYFVDELGIGDWGRRWYIFSLGRWLSRDPIKEKGFLVSSFFESSGAFDINRIVEDVLKQYAAEVSIAVERLNHTGLSAEATILQNNWNNVEIMVRNYFGLIALEDSYIFVHNAPIALFDVLGLQYQETHCQDRCDRFLEIVCGDVYAARRKCYEKCAFNPSYIPKLSDLIEIPQTKPKWPDWLDWVRILGEILEKMKQK